MSGLDNPIVFYPSAILLIIFALLSIGLRNIFYSLISAIGVSFLAGLMFYLLGSEYNAVIQIAIYGVAVPVILALAIMFTNHKQKDEKRNSTMKYSIFLTCGLFILTTVYWILTSFAILPEIFNSSYICYFKWNFCKICLWI